MPDPHRIRQSAHRRQIAFRSVRRTEDTQIEPDGSATHGSSRFFSVTRNPLTVLIAAFVVSRIAFYLAGVRYELEGYGFHLLDIHLLRDDLTSSVWHMHMQPPLLNLFIGGVLKLPGPAEKPFATGCNLLLGLALVLSCYLLLVELRTPRTVAMLVTLVGVVASPS